MTSATLISSNPADAAKAAALGVPFQLNPTAAEAVLLVVSDPGGFRKGYRPPPADQAGLNAAITDCATAAAAAQTAAAGQRTIQATIQANLLANQQAIQTWIAANPGGAVLTPAQTLAVAKMLNGLCRLLLAQLDSAQGT